MAEPSTADLMKELRDMDRFLNNMQKDAKKLLGEAEEPTSLEKMKQSEEKRRLSSASSWARSTTKKDNPLAKRKNSEGGASIVDVTKAERYVKTRTPEYTFGVRTPRSEERKNSDGYFNGDYDVKVDSLSTLKRPKTSVISKTARLDPYGYRISPVVKLHQPVETDALEPESTTVDEGKAQCDMDLGLDDQSETPSEAERPHKSEKVLAAKAYSFGRDKRFTEPKAEPMVVAVIDSDAEDGVKVLPAPILDVERAAKAIMPRTGTAVMGPRPSAPVSTRYSPAQEDAHDDNEANDGAYHTKAANTASNKDSVPLNMHLDALSYRPRTPNVTMRPDRPTQRTPPVHIDLGTPGPGYYNTTTADVEYTSATISTNKRNKYSKPVGTIYHTSTKPKNESALYAKQAHQASQAATLGPGIYNTAQSIHAVKHNAPAYTLYASSAEAKPTPQMLRKQYFEQKARDLREVHDNQSETNLTLVTARTPVTSLAPPKWSKRDPHKEEILTEHRIRNIHVNSTARSGNTSRLDHLLGSEFGSLHDEGLYTSPNKKFSAVEKRVKTGAFMKAEVTARRSTSARLQSRPGVAMRVAEEKAPIPGLQRFYGPQIPVPWTADRLPGYTHPNNTDVAQEVLQMLADRAANNNNTINIDNPNVHLYNKDIHDTAYTEAYLKSTYSGSLQPKKPAIVMQPSKQDERNINNKLTLEQQERDYIGPQLQQQWIDENNKTHTIKNNTLRMDLVPGREIIKQHAKGITEVITFNDKILPSDDPGPGQYENNHLNIAHAGAKTVPFNKQIARQDMVGAYGERPESAIQDMHILAAEGLVEPDIYYEENIMLDYGTAKDRVVDTQKHKNLQLYVKERHPAPKPATDDHLGGTYFQGMAETALKKPGLLFEKQTSRFEDNNEKEALKDVLGPLEGELDLQVKDYNPHKGNITQNVVMQDPKKYPRFVTSKPEIYDPDAPLPNLDFYDFNTKKEPILVNMDRMQGRKDGDRDYENEFIAEEKMDSEGALRLAAEQDTARHTAHANQSNQKRVIQSVHMDKQTKHTDNAPIQSETLLNYANNETSHRYYDDPDLTKPVIEDPNRKLKNNVRDWSKVPGRNEANNDTTNRDEMYDQEAKMLGGEILPGREELELDPNREGTSKHKKVQGGVEWTKNSDIPRFPAPTSSGQRVNEEGSIVPTEHLLDLNDVDPGKFKPGMAPLGTITTGANLSNQTGRSNINDLNNAPNNPQNRKILDSLGLGEELILEPGANPMQKSTQKAQFGSKNNTAGVENTNAGNKVLQELKKNSENPENQELKLEPSDAPLRKRVQGSVSMQNKSANNTHKMDTVVGELDQSLEVLKLSPRAADKHLYANPVLATSMGNKNIIYESHHAAGINEEIRKSTTVLDLSPTDKASKFRVTGGTSMGNKQVIRNSSNEVLAIQEYNRTSTQELKIDPTIQATRVSIPSSALSREPRIPTHTENNINKQLNNQDEILDLEPTKPRRVKSNTTMHSTEHRFNSHREDNFEKELNSPNNDLLGTTQPELLIIEPTDKTIKKNPSEVKFGGAVTGRGGAIAKETVSARNKNTATDTNNGRRTLTTSAGGSANKTAASKANTVNSGSGKLRSATPVGNKRPTATDTKVASHKITVYNDAPTTPQVTVPELSSKPPIFKKLSKSEMNAINEL